MSAKQINQREALNILKKGESLSDYSIQMDATRIEALDAMLLRKNGIPLPEELVYYADEDIQPPLVHRLSNHNHKPRWRIGCLPQTTKPKHNHRRASARLFSASCCLSALAVPANVQHHSARFSKRKIFQSCAAQRLQGKKIKNMLEYKDLEAFKITTQQWFKEHGELAVMLEGNWGGAYAHLFSSYHEMMIFLEQAGTTGYDTVWATYQYNWPIRGMVDDDFLRQVEEYLDSKMEFVLLEEKEGGYYAGFTDLYDPTLRAETLAEIEEHRGEKAIFGRFPWYRQGENLLDQVITGVPFLFISPPMQK